MKTPESYSNEEVQKFGKQITKHEVIYKLAYPAFINTYDSLCKNNSVLFKDLAQPMQIIVFNKKRANIAHFINCNIGGFPLKWNRTQSFDNFPLKTNGFIEPEYKVSFEEIQHYVLPQISDAEADSLFNANDYVYVIYFTKFMNSLTKGMFKNLDKHLAYFSNEKIGLIYIFCEDLFTHDNAPKEVY